MRVWLVWCRCGRSLNESPSEKEGKCGFSLLRLTHLIYASMKVPPKRKGNRHRTVPGLGLVASLNESPSEKEGKWRPARRLPVAALCLNESPSEKEGK